MPVSFPDKKKLFSLVNLPKGSFLSNVIKDMVRLFPAIMSMFCTRFGTRVLYGVFVPPEALGIFTLYLYAQRHISTLTTGWLRQASSRFVPENQQYLPLFLRWGFFVVGITALVGCLVGAGLKLTIFQQSRNFEWLYLMLTVGIFISVSVFELFQIYLRSVFETKRVSGGRILLGVTLISLLAIFLPFSTDYVASMLTAFLIANAIGIAYQYGTVARKAKGKRSKLALQNYSKAAVLKKSLQYGGIVSIAWWLVALSLSGDRYLLAGILSMQQVGIYTFWMGIGFEVIRGGNSLVFMAVNPRLFQAHGDSPEKAVRYASRMTDYYVLIALPGLVLLGTVIPELFRILKVKELYMPQANLLFFSMGMAFCIGLSEFSGKRRQFSLKVNVFAYAGGAAIVVMAGSIYYLSAMFGLYGAALGALLGSITYSAIVTIGSRGWPMPSTAAFAVIAFVVMLIIHSQFIDFGRVVLVSSMSLVYSVYLFFIWRYFVGKKRIFT